MKREFRPGDDVRTDDEILHFCREYGATIFHPSGTAKMWPSAAIRRQVVDARLRVHGVAGLRVVDRPVMPTLVLGQHQCAGRDDGRARGGLHSRRCTAALAGP
ncbi:GMC oxidoreductase, partial [Cupriavidus basilensis]